jgi:hypothetical protein
MSRTLTLLFRRDPTRDRNTGATRLEGYTACWPDDGLPVSVSLDAFCTHGQRLLGLGKYLAGSTEKLVKLICLPISGRDDDLNRLPGHRVRRFFIHRTGEQGRIHFLDGTPTETVFALGQDDYRITSWIGLNDLDDGAVQWFDLAAVQAEMPHRFRHLAATSGQWSMASSQ